MKEQKARAEDVKFIWAQFFCFLLFICQSQCLSVFAVTKIHKVYFSENNALIINTKEKSPLEVQEIQKLSPKNFKIYFPNSKLTRQLDKKIATDDLKVSFKELKNKIVELNLEYTQAPEKQIQSRTILDGLAYEIFAGNKISTVASSDSDSVVNDVVALENESDTIENFTGIEAQDTKLTEETLEKESEHQLQISKSDKNFISIANSKPSVTENFLNELDSELTSSIMASPKFIKETHEKIDSVALTNLANLLNEQGLIDEAYKAYQEALSLDAKNNQAYLGIASITSDNQEKLTSYLATIDSKALIEIGKGWFQSGEKISSTKQLMQAFIPFQFAILKEPKNPEMRFAYANILKEAGFNFYPEASKRYLEAAALAKELYQKGDLKVEGLMRESAENLIKIVCHLGKQEDAIKYCNSYLNLGFDRFLDGRPILGLVKEIRFNKNPFLKG